MLLNLCLMSAFAYAKSSYFVAVITLIYLTPFVGASYEQRIKIKSLY